MKPKICATITGKTVDETVLLSTIAQTLGADMLELRLDYMDEYKRIEDIVRSTKIPIILTLRKRDEGGKFKGSEHERVDLLLEIATKGFKFVDVELTTPSLPRVVRKLRGKGVQVIVSAHDFKSTPSLPKMADIVKEEIQAGADICKLVTTARDIRDNLLCLDLVSQMSKKVKIICFAMGPLGVSSRILAPLFGSFLTFASIMKGKESASGQLPINELRNIYQALGIL